MRGALLVSLLLVVLAGCGGSSSGGGSGGGRLTVSAATSLTTAFTKLGGAAYSFGGSDELAAQIRKGVKPDVYAAANTKLPEALFRAGLIERPQVFARNRLVLAVPGQGGKVTSLADAGKAGVKLAIGSPSVPVGMYTRKVIAGLPPGLRKAILGNVRSEEPDVGGVVGKLTQGAVDAGFVYVTDVEATGGRLRAIGPPQNLDPEVAYGVAVVKGAKHPAAARSFVKGLLAGKGRDTLRAAGFLPSP